MMRRWIKNSAFLFGGLALGSFAFDCYYRHKYAYVQFEAVESPLLSQEVMLVPIHWIQENHYEEDMAEIVIPTIYDSVKQYQITSNDITFRVNHFKFKNRSPQATILLLHGFKEFKEVYSELIYYLLQLNYEVFTYDHRGHGESMPEKDSDVEVDDFVLYVDDAQTIVNEIVKPNKAANKLILLAHSMGGLIGLNLLELQPNIFDGAILNCPELMLNTGNLPTSFANLMIEILCQFDVNNELVLTESVLEDTRFNYLLKELILSRSPKRRDFIYALGTQLYGHNEDFGSIRWVSNSFKTMTDVVTPDKLSKVKIPMLIIRAEEDDLISSAGLYTAVHYLPNARLIYIPEGRHESLLDKDTPLYALVSTIHQTIQQVIHEPHA